MKTFGAGGVSPSPILNSAAFWKKQKLFLDLPRSLGPLGVLLRRWKLRCFGISPFQLELSNLSVLQFSVTVRVPGDAMYRPFEVRPWMGYIPILANSCSAITIAVF